MLRIADTRCVHQKAAQASCERCVQICPQRAWRLSGDGLGFDEDLCDGCGLCVAACPTGALALAAEAPQATPAGRRDAVTLVCDTAAPEGGVPTGGQVRQPCVHNVDEQQLLQWHRTGIRNIEVKISDCRSCSRGRTLPPEDRLNERLALVNRALQARRQPPLSLRATVVPAKPITVSSPPHDRPPLRPETPSRRSFLGLARVPPEEQRTPSTWPERRVLAQRHLRALGPGPALWAVHLQAQRCDACGACARLCPTSALAWVEAPSAPRTLQLDLAACVGCGLCVDVCAPSAIETLPPGSAMMSIHRINMTLVKCSCCGKAYAGVAQSSAQGRCPACRSPAARRSDRRVQDTPSPP